MVAPRQYATAGALRTALETRLLERSRRDAVDLHRLRCQADQKKRQGRPKARSGAFAGLVSEQLPPQARASSRCFNVGSFLIAFPVLASAKRSSYRL